MSRTKFFSYLLATAACCSWTQTAFAQTTEPQPGEIADEEGVTAGSNQEQGGVADIIVTAQRRGQSLQDVPISVTAIGGEQLAEAGITSSIEIPAVTPGLVMGQVRNTVNPYLRGIGTQAGTAGTEGAVAVYVDGVYLPSAVASLFSLNNIERVEVLRGPQGTLFGRNATGGLIHIITREPSQTPTVLGSIGLASYETVSGSLYVTGPISDSIAADLAINGSYQGDGWGRNLFLGNEVNMTRQMMIRSRVRFDVGPGTSVLVSGDLSLSANDSGSVRMPLPGTVMAGGVKLVGTPYDRHSAQPFEHTPGRQYGGSVLIRHDLSDSVNLTSTTAYRRLEVPSFTDVDTTPRILSDFEFNEFGRTFQQELLLGGKTGRLDWIVGIFIFKSTAGYDPVSLFATDGPPSTATAARFTKIQTDSYAGFAQGTYAITDTTNLTAGIRYTYDDGNISGRFVALPGNILPPGTVFVDAATLPRNQTHRNWDAITWRLAVDQELSEDVLVYASANRGFKSGAFNGSDVRQPAVNPETITAYELGLKSNFFDRQVRFNVAAFYNKYNQIQLQSITPLGSVNFNATSGTIKGVDVELEVAPRLAVGDLSILASGSFLDTKYGAFPNSTCTTPRPLAVGGNVVSQCDVTGNEMVRAPDLTTSIIADYNRPVTDQFLIGVNVTWQHSGGFYWEPDNRIRQPSYDLINTRFYFGPEDNRWRLSLWARNLLDEVYYTYASATGFGDVAAAAEPRTFGVSLDFRFGG